MVLDPYALFYSFIASVQFDHSVLLDFLISSETRFLAYLLHTLKRVTAAPTNVSRQLESDASAELYSQSVHPMHLEEDSSFDAFARACEEVRQRSEERAERSASMPIDSERPRSAHRRPRHFVKLL
jgi:predicted component of type VI protein secretion system